MSTQRIYDNDVVLTNIFQGYMPADQDFIHKDILPEIKVEQENGDIPETVSTGQDFLRVQPILTVSDAGLAEITADYSKASKWQTQEYGAEIRVTKRDGKNFAKNGETWQSGMERAREMKTKQLKIFRMICKEYALASYVFNAANYESTNKITLSGTDQFNVDSSDPQGVFSDAQVAIERYSHADPDRLTAVIPWPIYKIMIRHPQLKRTNGVSPDGTVPVRDLKRAELATALNVDKILVPRLKRETANIGQTSSLARIWGNFIMLFYVNPNPNPEQWEYTFGYEFVLDAPQVGSYPHHKIPNVEFVQFMEEYDQLILNSEAAYLITNPIATFV